MLEDKNTPKIKNAALNVIYSLLVFIALSSIGFMIADPSFSSNTDGKVEVTAGKSLAVGVSLLLTVAFSMWFARKNKR